MAFFTAFCQGNVHDLCKTQECACHCHWTAEEYQAISFKKDFDKLSVISYHFWVQAGEPPAREAVKRVIAAFWPAHLAFTEEFTTIIVYGASHDDWSRSRLFEKFSEYFPGGTT